MRAILLTVLMLLGTGASAQVEANAIAAVNAARAVQGLAPLRTDPKLMRAAAGHAADMARRGKMTHRGADGSKPLRRVQAAGLRACWVSENIAMGPWNGRQVAQAWMQSAGHRKNALNRKATRVGAAKKGNAWVMVFARPC